MWPRTTPGTSPIAKHAAARNSTGPVIETGTSLEFATLLFRCRPRSTKPTTLTKQKTASAAVAASAAAASAPWAVSAAVPICARCTSDCRVSHSDAKPLKGGTPAMAIAPTRKAVPVNGMVRSNPPSPSRSRVPTCLWNEPAHKNNSDLKSA